MVANPYRDALVLPGGIIELDESPATAAAREVREETGLTVSPSRLLAVEHLPAQGAVTSGLRFVFDADPVEDGVPLTPQPTEVSDLLWLTPDEAIARHTTRGKKRLELAIHAQAVGASVYLDDGRYLLPPGLLGDSVR